MARKHRKKSKTNMITPSAMVPLIPPSTHIQHTTLTTQHWQYLEAYLYTHLRAQPIIKTLLEDVPLHIVVLTLSDQKCFYLGAYADEQAMHPHNHVLKCHMLQICLALDMISEAYYDEEININCGAMRRLFRIEHDTMIMCAKNITNNTSHH